MVLLPLLYTDQLVLGIVAVGDGGGIEGLGQGVTVNSYEVGRRRIPVSTLPLLASLLATSIDELLLGEKRKKPSSKRGPTFKLQQQMERVSLLPRATQKFVMEMIDTVIQQAS